MEKKFPKFTKSKRMNSMLRVDFRRMFLTPLFYIILGIAIIAPILIVVMTGMMEGSPLTDSQTGEPVLDADGNQMYMEGFDHAWQIIGSTSSTGGAESGAGMSMSLTSMCNIDLLYFGIAVLVCIFVAGDFRSGYSKNLFTVRSKKGDYVISKILVCGIAGALLVLGFFGGAVIGGAISGLPFTMEGFNAGNLACCILGKMLMMLIFSAIYSLMGIIAKQRLWLSILLSLCTGMFLFNIVPMVTPLDATVINVLFAAVGAGLLALGLGAISRLILKKRDVL